VKALFSNVSFTNVCQLFGKSRQAWYDINQRGADHRLREELLIQWVEDIRLTLPRTGTIKLHSMLEAKRKEHGITIGRDAFFDLLRRHDLLVQPKKKYVRTTQSYHRFRKWPNLIEGWVPQRAEHLWVSDITYLRTESGFIYLSLITDAFSRMIVGYHLSQQLRVSGCIASLQKAIKSRKGSIEELIHHSDRGIQYCCDEYVQLLQSHQIQISMTQSGSPYDNAIAERINGILKQEFNLDATFKSYSQAIEPVANAIHNYNNIRPHFSCHLLTPQKKHQLDTS
jgi:putative transposase